MDRIVSALVVAVGLLTACATQANDHRTIVASVYPLAWAAEGLAEPGWEVIDLTPPGGEAHDIELTLEQRTAIEEADVVLYLGDIGFQPQVEQAVDEASGTVVAVTEGLDLLEGHAHEEEGAEHEEEEVLDPHVWLDPVRFAEIVGGIQAGIEESDPGTAMGAERAGELQDDLAALDDGYRSSLATCESRTMVVSHEAFGYLADRYGLEQVGLAELAPEAEPTVEALGEAGDLLRSGVALAVFYEADPESRRIAETVAADTDTVALPLNTLESRPQEGDYLSVMDDNLDSLRQGLGCT